jgi:hypothetical protein
MKFNTSKDEPKPAPVFIPEPKQLDVFEEERSIVSLADLSEYFDCCHIKGQPDPVIGNESIRLAAILAWSRGIPVFLRGSSGTAKTRIAQAIVSLIYGDQALEETANGCFTVSGETSQKGHLNTDIESDIVRSQRCYVPEYQNVQNLEAMIKLWLEGRTYEYVRTKKASGSDGFDSERLSLPPLPVLTCLADGNEKMPELTNEMQRRVLQLYTESRKELNERVHVRKAEQRYLCRSHLKHPDDGKVRMLSKRLQTMICGQSVRVINPCAPELRCLIPTRYPISNTVIDYLFNMVEAVTLFYAPYRVHRNTLEGTVVMATPGDNYIAAMLIGDNVVDMAIGAHDLAKPIFKFLPKATMFDFYEGAGLAQSNLKDISVPLEEIMNFLDSMGYAIQRNILKEIMTKLCDVGIATEYNERGKKGLYYRTRDSIGDDTDVDWESMSSNAPERVKSEYPDMFQEYTSTDLGKYYDPFNGDLKSLPKHTKKKAVVVSEEDAGHFKTNQTGLF